MLVEIFCQTLSTLVTDLITRWTFQYTAISIKTLKNKRQWTWIRIQVSLQWTQNQPSNIKTCQWCYTNLAL